MQWIKIRGAIILIIFSVMVIVMGVLLWNSEPTGKADGGYVQGKNLNVQKPVQYYVPDFPAKGFLITSDLLASVSSFISD